MPSFVRRGGVVVAMAMVVGLVGLVQPARSAARPGPAVDLQAWTRTSPAPTFLTQPGRTYVAADAGAGAAAAFVRVVDLDAGGGSAALVLTEAAADTATVAGAAAVRACPLTTPLVGAGELSADRAPGFDCAAAVPVVRSSDGRWQLTLDSFLPAWRAGGETGVALVSAATDVATFRVAFDVAATTISAPVAPSAGDSAPAPTLTVPDADPPAGGVTGGATVPASRIASGFPTPAGLIAPPSGAAGRPPSEPGAHAAVSPSEAVLIAAPTTTATSGSSRSASSPPAALVVGLIALAGALVLPFSRQNRPGGRGDPDARSVVGRFPAGLLGAAPVVAVPALLGEATVYKLGLVLILFVGAIGLHLLVNWTGELSLAHATLVGLPAFAVAKLSAEHDVSPVLLLPAGVVVGLAAGLVVGIPAIRARGLQVALVTLAAGVAIDRFFFTKTWMIGGAGGHAVEVPTLGPLTFTTAKSLYPVLLAAVAAAAALAWGIYRSKIGRGLLWVKAQPDAAAAFGIPVGRYRVLAYALAGGFAGFSGALTAMWVQRVTAEAFPLSRSFTYLIAVALAGRGFVGGVAVAAAFLEGGRLFLPSGSALIIYGAPVGLIVTLTRHQAGLNGLVGRVAARFRRTQTATTSEGRKSMRQREIDGLRPQVVVSGVLIAMGLAAIALGWYHAGNTREVWIQNQELLSGGAGGLALVIVGVGVLLHDGMRQGRAVDAARLEQLLGAIVPPAALAPSNGQPAPSNGQPAPSNGRARRARSRLSA